jgi:nucleotide-binding universal stress UspA family protein
MLAKVIAMKILLPVDGSKHSVRAVRHVISTVDGCTGRQIFLINVQAPISAPEVLSHMPRRKIEEMQNTRGEDALVSSRELLDQAGLTYVAEVLVGEIPETINRYAVAHACDKIVMGVRGLGTLGGALLGSVSARLMQLTKLPVTLVK